MKRYIKETNGLKQNLAELQGNFNSKNNFIMFEDLVRHLSMSLDEEIQRMEKLHQNLLTEFSLRLGKSLSQGGGLLKKLEIFKKNKMNLEKMDFEIVKAMNGYYKDCENFEKIFVKKQIVEDKGPYCKNIDKEIQELEKRILEIHQNLGIKEREYRNKIEGYNKHGKTLISQNVRHFLKFKNPP